MLLIAEVALRLARRFNFMFSLTAARQSLPLGLLKRNKQSVPIEACFVGYLFGALPANLIVNVSIATCLSVLEDEAAFSFRPLLLSTCTVTGTIWANLRSEVFSK